MQNFGVERVRQTPTQDEAAVPIQHGHEVPEAVTQRGFGY